VKKALLAVMLCLTLVCLYSLSAAAADARNQRPQHAHTQASKIIHPAPGGDAVVAPVKIYSNLGPSGDLYDSSNGYFVSGSTNPFNGQKQDIAVPFTPRNDATVTRVKAALQYYNIGGNGAMLAIYDDAGGLPGQPLAHRLRGNFDPFGSGCCNLALWTLSTPLKVKAGTQYWVVGTTNNKTMDAISTWDFVWDDAPGTFAFQQDDGGWILLNASFGYAPSAVAVRGTRP
jgi:hypothetical protein